METKKFILTEQEIPTAWYNILAEMKNKPQPMKNPKTGEPLKEEDLYPTEEVISCSSGGTGCGICPRGIRKTEKTSGRRH